LLLRAAVLVTVLAACSDDAPTSCPIGDRTLPIEFVAVYFPSDGAVGDIVDGGDVPLRRPIQGGKVMYVGVRAKNVDGCNVQLTAALRDPVSQQVIALEQRPVRLVDSGDGWGRPESEYDHLANLPACPSAAATHDVDDSSWLLELRLDETGGRTATTTITVVPRCDGPGEMEECACECDSDYVIGSPCPVDPVDAGVD
jgi:hypothetical protein